MNILDQPGINHSGELRGFLVSFFYAMQIKPSTAPKIRGRNLDGQVSLQPPCNNKNAVFANASGVKQSSSDG
ncbi:MULTISPECIES: hypothetical protein [Nitrosomonas]|uniref:hypothetical protein n=1 Tax=Nitrosomonas TaxID=914 RepID=UPI0023F2A56A|nr:MULTISPECIES: hypothetical protein [Nitrosomonas]